jgi:hypothetical protein
LTEKRSKTFPLLHHPQSVAPLNHPWFVVVSFLAVASLLSRRYRGLLSSTQGPSFEAFISGSIWLHAIAFVAAHEFQSSVDFIKMSNLVASVLVVVNKEQT